jgi:acetyl esterase/lipase
MNENERVIIEQGVPVGVAPGRDGGADRTLLADVYRPPTGLGEPPAAGWPAVLLVHGGAWRGGDRGQLRGYGILLARAGWLVVACEYRLSPVGPFGTPHGPEFARWPEHLHDVKTALRWMKANTDLHLDPDRVVIHGNSAGGHLALVAAGTPGVPELEGTGGNPDQSTAVAACIAIYPATLMGAAHGNIAGILTEEPTDDMVRQCMPLTWATSDFPPTLLIHGAKDEVVSAKHSTEMYDALRRAGAPVDLHIFADQPHGFDANPPFGRRIAQEILFFLERYVPEPAASPAVVATST